MPTFPLSGGCHCGAVRFELLGPPLSIQHCHCENCRKISGEFTSTGAIIRRSDIRISGAENLKGYRTSPSFERQFCQTCSCYLFAYEDSEQDLLYFAPATIDGGQHPGHPRVPKATYMCARKPNGRSSPMDCRSIRRLHRTRS